MKKLALLITLVAVFALIASANALAQETRGDLAVGGAVTLAFPFGDLADVAGTGYGLEGLFEYGWNENISGQGSLGFMKWGSKTTGLYDWSYSHYKLVGGAKYYFKPGKTGWFGGAEVGFHIYSSKWEWVHPIQGTIKESSSSTDLTISPMGGYEMPMGSSGMRWSFTGILAWAGDMYLGIRVGLLYPLGKGQETTETTDDAMNIEDTIHNFAGVN